MNRLRAACHWSQAGNLQPEACSLKLSALICLMLPLLSAPAFSSGAGSTGGQVLQLVPDARTAGMAYTFTAVADDINSLHYNPAGLGAVTRFEASLANDSLLEGVNHQFLGLAYRLRDVHSLNVDDLGTVAAGITSLNSGDIAGRDAAGAATGVFRSQDQVLTLAYGKAVLSGESVGRVLLGASAKFVTEELKNVKSYNTVYDAGALWQLPVLNLSAGAALQNIGGKMGYLREKFDAPQTLRLGASYRSYDDTFLVGLDMAQPSYGNSSFHLGGEYYFLKSLIVRAGYATGTGQGSGLAGGFGVSLKEVDIFFLYAQELDIDYAFMPYGDLGDMQRLSLTLKLGAD